MEEWDIDKYLDTLEVQVIIYYKRAMAKSCLYAERLDSINVGHKL